MMPRISITDEAFQCEAKGNPAGSDNDAKLRAAAGVSGGSNRRGADLSASLAVDQMSAATLVPATAILTLVCFRQQYAHRQAG